MNTSLTAVVNFICTEMTSVYHQEETNRQLLTETHKFLQTYGLHKKYSTVAYSTQRHFCSPTVDP